MITIKKTDSRHSGSNIFSYYAEVSRGKLAVMGVYNQITRAGLLKEYNALRLWCVDTWGMSCDRSHYLELVGKDPSVLNNHWCWHTEFNELKIYLKSDQEANWLKLKFL